MRVPRRLADRLIVVSREDYVRAMDDRGSSLDDEHVTIVPVPLLGRWHEFAGLRGARLGAGGAYLRDPADPGRFLTLAEAFQQEARANGDLFLRVCGLLGAVKVTSLESGSHLGKDSTKNTFHAGTGQDAAAGPDAGRVRAGLTRDVSATFTRDVRQELVYLLETAGEWPGGEPDIAEARAAVEGRSGAVAGDLRELIDLRAAPGNRIDRWSRRVDFLSELDRDLTFLLDAAARLELAAGPESASAGVKLSNAFERTRSERRQAKVSVEVWFTRPAPPG
ncbi:hypothetical protein Sru01_16570 [Sphaerisporangium rufum]|uniref:Uncharacterized protein n=1 Tax=Sphaerisporangium rufum TaxID=1381558 RepID=A0A919R1I2_9ACTN|nr:hypothetical protein [Sphaerisporangium rufum]GII76675.1 hypothetical protein Sru01_16570 [Sphaerisporangium rufum]